VYVSVLRRASASRCTVEIKGDATRNSAKSARNAGESPRLSTRVTAGEMHPIMMLPQPDPAFHWRAEVWGHSLRCDALGSVAQHLFTTRQLELRPSTSSGRPEALAGRSEKSRAGVEKLAPGWTLAAASLGAHVDQVVRVKQVHGRSVRVLKKGAVTPADVIVRPEADALVSDEPGLVLAVQIADCVPALMADRRRGAVGAVHAGWRGACARIVSETVATMAHQFGTDPRDLIVAIGPSIGACCYEVGEELVDAFRGAGTRDDQLSRWFSRDKGGALRLDLWAASVEQFREAGVPDDRIFVARLCTQTHQQWLDSFRAAGENAGRMAGMIKVP
jgi:YfiH family protein